MLNKTQTQTQTLLVEITARVNTTVSTIMTMKAALPLQCGLNLDFLRRSAPDEYLITRAAGVLVKLSNIQSDHN